MRIGMRLRWGFWGGWGIVCGRGLGWRWERVDDGVDGRYDVGWWYIWKVKLVKPYLGGHCYLQETRTQFAASQ